MPDLSGGGVAENKAFADVGTGVGSFGLSFNQWNNAITQQNINYNPMENYVGQSINSQPVTNANNLVRFLHTDINSKTGILQTYKFDWEYYREHGGGYTYTAYLPKETLLDYGNHFQEIKGAINSLTTAVNNIPTTITASASSSSSGGGTAVIETDDTPMVSVTVNTNFDVPLSVYDDIASGTSSDGKVQVVNSTVGDKLIHLKGKLTQVGIFQYKINGKTFNIKVIENPTATNVVVRLE